MAKRLFDKINYVYRVVTVSLHAVYLFSINKFSRMPVTGPNGPVVSITTFGARERDAYLTIESIALGRLKPSRIVL
jgi:hypothetical protein